MILLRYINFTYGVFFMREQKDRYEIFLKVCETGSFSKAAEALNGETGTVKLQWFGPYQTFTDREWKHAE